MFGCCRHSNAQQFIRNRRTGVWDSLSLNALVAGEANKIETRSVTRFESLPNPRATVTLSSESLKSMASSIQDLAYTLRSRALALQVPKQC